MTAFVGQKTAGAFGAPVWAGHGRACARGGLVPTGLSAAVHGPAFGLRNSVVQVEDIAPRRANAP